jgi:hypothetical protein
MLLQNWLPSEYKEYFENKRIEKLLNKTVIASYGNINEEDKRWPGTHKNVICWCVLDTGHAIGMNENPSIGISLPIVKIDLTRKI